MNIKKIFFFVSQFLQLTFFYCFALLDLFYNVVLNIYNVGYQPELLMPYYPLFEAIVENPALSIFGNQEKVFLFSYFTLEFIIQRSLFRFSRLVKYNILFIFAMQMIQGWTFALWDVLCNRQASPLATPWIVDTVFLGIDVLTAGKLFLLTFLVSITMYTWGYIQALRNKYVQFGPAFLWLTDSVSWILRIRSLRKRED